MNNWNLADNPWHRRTVLVRMLTDFCQGDAIQPTQVYLLKRLLFAHVKPTEEARPGWYASIAHALLFLSGGSVGRDVDADCDLHRVVYDPSQPTTVDRCDELLRLFREKRLPNPVWHILTDVDDTLFAHPDWAAIAGYDRSWDTQVPYPGIVAFYQRFYAHVPAMCRYSTVLSATPSIWRGRRLRDPIIHQVLNQSNIGFGFLHGFDALTPYLSPNRHVRFGHEKYRKFVQYINLFPEHRVVFIGDEGQGDVIAGRLMRTHHPDTCHVFIHRLSADARTYTAPHHDDDAALAIHYFRDYAELAVLFRRQLQLFTDADVEAIHREVCARVAESSTTSAEAGERNRNLYASCHLATHLAGA